jgi:hypothetical protein
MTPARTWWLALLAATAAAQIPSTPVGHEVREDDLPAIAAAPDGSLWVREGYAGRNFVPHTADYPEAGHDLLSSSRGAYAPRPRRAGPCKIRRIGNN